MCSSPPPLVSPAITVLIADSNRMQAQLLTSALRRRSEFRISTCQVDIASILGAVTSSPAKVVVLSLNHSVNIASQMAAMRRVHLSHPAVAKVLLVESYDRELVVSAFRSGARGIFCISDTHFRLLCRCIQRVADGQIWANTEQMTFLLDLISEVPFAARAQLPRPTTPHPARGTGCRSRRRGPQQSRYRPRTRPQRAHH
jgi:two-component system nitrate/nitrite response regulator NarL